MKYQHAKAFRSNDTNIVAEKYFPNKQEYYTFVKSQRDKGLRQVIVTSEMMISILKTYFLDYKFQITGIEFIAEDNELQININNLLEEIKTNRELFAMLIEKLDFIMEETSIDIRKIEIAVEKGKIYLQVNGLFGITDSLYSTEFKRLIEAISRAI